jgi:hypothetical protein
MKGFFMARKTIKQIHTVSRPGGWGNLKAGASRVSKIYKTKSEAQKAGRETAIKLKAEHVIHNEDHKIASRNSYGNDPRRIKG